MGKYRDRQPAPQAVFAWGSNLPNTDPGTLKNLLLDCSEAMWERRRLKKRRLPSWVDS